MKLPTKELISQITDIDIRQILDMEIVENEIILTYNEYAKYQNPKHTYDFPFDLNFLMCECKRGAINSLLKLEFHSALTKNGGICKIYDENGNELFKSEVIKEKKEKIKNEFGDELEEFDYSEIESVFDCYQWYMDNARKMVDELEKKQKEEIKNNRKYVVFSKRGD